MLWFIVPIPYLESDGDTVLVRVLQGNRTMTVDLCAG